ncbi:maleylacetate reductase [Paractinoplanes ferrugineus]|uniref:Maleylacetate reductase n=1 Tax=Paractinoplanes ferrugineus TaxID=113564 RepID=A0A919J5L3_9ACTN|nr:maleylacetate reductase [Actinoplanes ferrugineus]GIE11016.1 maleylacetate reductase [Actinoplanes ferrugineus]
MTRSFTYAALPMRVVFGADSLSSLPTEISALGFERVLVLCGPRQEALGKQIVATLGDRAVGILPEAVMHVPAAVAARAVDVASQLGADSCLAVGGGSSIGLGKAVAKELGLPVVAVPTTYAGSEMTPVWGLTTNGVKRTGRDSRVLPVSVIYDPSLTVSMPASLSVTSGFNAIAHAVEGLYAPDASPIVSLMAVEGATSLATALPGVASDISDLSARSTALYGAWLCGAVLGATTMSLHHKLCHALGGTLNLPHAETHTVVLPHVLAFNAPAAPAAVAALSRAFDCSDPARYLFDLADSLGAPGSLAELGMAFADIDRVADAVAESSYANPRPASRNEIAALLRAAWEGALN